MSSQIDRVFSKINSNKVIALTRDLVRIPSVNPPGEEQEVAGFYAERMRKLGLEVTVFDVKPGRPNVVGVYRGGDGPTIMFNGHLDVVPPGDIKSWSRDPFGGQIENGRIYGRGSTDMKGGLAAMLTMVEAIKESGIGIKGNIMLTGVMDEESGGEGTQVLIRKGYKADMCVVAEPTELKVLIAHKGNLWLEVTTFGKAVHSSTVRSKNPRVGLNAIYKMNKITSAMEKYLLELEKRPHPLVGNPTVSVGTISGGTKTNVVPDKCTITLDRRLLPGETHEQAREEIDQILDKLRQEDPELKIEIRPILTRPATQVSPDERIVKIGREAVAAVTGNDPGATGFPAGTDLAYLINDAKIPGIVLGPGSLSLAHNVNEYIEIDEIVKATKIFAHITLKALGTI